MNDLGGAVSRELESLDTSDPAAVQRITQLADADGITIHSAHVSKPLLSFGSSERTIVKVAYSLPQQSSREEYWRFSDSLVGGWRYRGRSSAVSYYLNFF